MNRPITKLHSFSIFCFLSIGISFNIHAQFDQFSESYSTLSTIAGKGEMDDRSQSGWLVEYENGSALDAELTRPHFAMADSAGNIYIADKDAHGIRKVTPEGIISTVAGTISAGDNGDGVGTESQLSSPNGIWVKADGTVYILDLGNNKIRRLNTNGMLETVVDDPNGIAIGRGLWVTPNEDSIFYASSSTVKLWTTLGGIENYSTGYASLGNICMDKNGYLIATDRGGHTVYRIAKDGTSKEVIAGNGGTSGGGHGQLATETGLAEVRGVWFLDDNSYFLATHEGSQVWYVDNNGRIYLFLDGRNGDEYHSGDGENYQTPGFKISEARSVTVDYEGNVLITENDLGFVRKIQNDYVYYYTSTIESIRNQQQIALAYPNPVTDYLYFNSNYANDNLKSFKLYNQVGAVILSRELASTQNNMLKIDCRNIENGVYYYELSDIDNKKQVGTVLISHE